LTAAVRDAMGGETISRNGEPGTKEAEAFVTGLNQSAERAQTLWFKFLTFTFALAVATGTTTHRTLFLESPLKLPVLNIPDIPLLLLAFYILAPVIFVVFHFYILLNLVLLARTAKSFEDALVRAFPEDGEARENFRMHAHRKHLVRATAGRRQAGARRDQRQAVEPHGADQPRGRAGGLDADVRGQVPALSQLADHLAASRLAGAGPRAGVDPLAWLSKRLGRSATAEGELVAHGAGNR
jgi:hypothetical protein